MLVLKVNIYKFCLPMTTVFLHRVVILYEHQDISVLLRFSILAIYNMSKSESESKVMRKFAKHRNIFLNFPLQVRKKVQCAS